jgi:hypothetical protein
MATEGHKGGKNIVISIGTSSIGRAAIRVIMYVETFNIDVINNSCHSLSQNVCLFDGV